MQIWETTANNKHKGLKRNGVSFYYVCAGFSVEAGNRRIPPPVKTKVAGCSGYEICLCAPFFLKIKYEWAFKKYSRIFRLFGGTH